MSQLRIFSYLPNPRIWKATIAARLCGVTIDVRGAAPGTLQDWLWDFDAHPLSEAERQDPALQRSGRTGFKSRLYKTPAFLEAHPFGTVPAAFSPDGAVGIFESNSIMRAVARLGADAYPLYGHDAYMAARVDSFLDVSLVFARDSQIYLLSLRDAVTPEIHARTRDAFVTYIAGIEQALMPARQFLVGDGITLADICFVAELSLFANEKPRAKALAGQGLAPILHDGLDADYPRAMAYYARLCAHPAFAPDVGPYLDKIAKAAAEHTSPRESGEREGPAARSAVGG
ncbi:glutathione S-transferase [Vineibacter terrae]|uniref:Glutathione S-transferase n=1 Tax=Vineibacter terrae TaxID=2586908 RepID=A0A5C8PM25_9HYPH|nr:glutathione S-transferase family protein [Vineibacter terrae]TXL75369.1 glutathione S-transferase [Vineibacter terrae]